MQASITSKLLLAALFLLISSLTVFGQRGGGLRGQVLDELGGAIVGASVVLTDAQDKQRIVVTDQTGSYRFNTVTPGTYSLRVSLSGFAPYRVDNVVITEGQAKTFDVRLSVQTVQEKVTVDPGSTVTTDPSNNKGAVVLKGKDLNALSDDPDELAVQLNALAGPTAGPNGAQVFVDGFTANNYLPDKQSIREIVINQNPFAAENERIGFGNIQIFTRPGTGQLHGGAAFTFSDAHFNSRNPYSSIRPPYQRRNYEVNLSGPVSKRASFFLSTGGRNIDDTAVINATILDTNLNPTRISTAVVTPTSRYSVSPRFDFQLNKTNTLLTRYNFNSSDLKKQGIGGFALSSRGFDYSDRMHILQMIETAVINPRTVNEAGFQYIWYTISQKTLDSSSGLLVLDAFSGGGSQIGQYSFKRGEGELRDYATITNARHTLKFGARLRWAHIADTAPTNYGGTFTFVGGKAPQLNASNQIIAGSFVDVSSLERYRRTVLFQRLGLSTAAIRTMGGGAAQLTVASGNPFAEVRQWDLAPFIQDDWKLRPDFTLSLGLRYQLQTNIGSHSLFAPRASFAWTPWMSAKGQPKTVVRGGAGVFYDLIRTNITLQANRFNGGTQTQFIVADPSLLDLFPSLPSAAALAATAQAQTIWRKATNLTEPYYLQSSISLERALPRNTSMSISYIDTRGLHQLRARNINAPLPTTGLRPLGPNNIYQYETSGIYKQHLLVFGFNSRFNPRVSLNANYTFGKANSDTDGPGSFAANPYDFRSEFGRTSFDVRHRFTLTGNIDTHWGLSFSPLLLASSGAPFNITTGTDDNGDSIFLDRPALATDLSRPSVRITSFGAFDLVPIAGARIIPRNFGDGPGYVSLNLRVGKTISFGPLPKPAATKNQAAAAAGKRPAQPSRPEARPYKLTFSVYLANILNHTNQGQPIGNLTSPLFGLSNSLSGNGQFTFGASAGQSNRSVSLRAQFQF